MSNKSVLAGNLKFLCLADLFQILGGNNSTGVLRVKSQYVPKPAQIYFMKGNPINASNGSVQGIDAIYALFGWTEGDFEFTEQGVNAKRVIKQSRMEIVLDAMRMVDDEVIKKVGPPSFDEGSVPENGGTKDGGEGLLKVMKGPLVNYSHILEEEEFIDGARITKEGGHGNWIWVILEGTVNISRETPEGPVTVARLGEGCFIGTVSALSFKQYSRSATVSASGDVWLGSLDTEYLSREYGSLSPDFIGLLFSMDGRLRKITDRVVELLMKEDKSKELIKDKKLIMKKGSLKEGAFTIIDGESCVIGHSKKSHIPLFTLTEKDVFGCVPFIDIGHEPRYASVMASKDLHVNKLDVESLKKEFDSLSDTLKNMILNTSTCIYTTTRMVYHLYENN
jgi:CRP-like cAMP-binding protein